MCAVEILRFACGFVGRQHRFAHMHIGVLSSVGVYRVPVAVGDFVDV